MIIIICENLYTPVRFPWAQTKDKQHHLSTRACKKTTLPPYYITTNLYHYTQTTLHCCISITSSAHKTLYTNNQVYTKTPPYAATSLHHNKLVPSCPNNNTTSSLHWHCILCAQDLVYIQTKQPNFTPKQHCTIRCNLITAKT